MAHALVHILGSRSGYTTLDASGGVTASERSELEVLTFGGATSGDALGRLESSASMIGRKLQSGRFAVSRMFPGGIDDEGRPTIEVVSVLLDRAGYEAVVGALPRLANELRIWRGCRESVAVGYELPEQSCAFRPNDPGVIRAFDAWNAARERDGIALLTSADSVSLLAMVALLDPTDLIECRWGIGVLSLSAPVDLCILATSTSRVGPRLVIAPASAGIMLSTKMDSALWLIRQNSDESQLPAVNKLRAASAEPIDEPEHDGWRPPIAEPRALSPAKRKNLTPIAALSAAASMLLLVGMIVLYVRVGKMRTTVNGDGGSGAQSVEPFSPNPAPTPQPKSDVPIEPPKQRGSEATVPLVGPKPIHRTDQPVIPNGAPVGALNSVGDPPKDDANTKSGQQLISDDPAAKKSPSADTGSGSTPMPVVPLSTDHTVSQIRWPDVKSILSHITAVGKTVSNLDIMTIDKTVKDISVGDPQRDGKLATEQMNLCNILDSLHKELSVLLDADRLLKEEGASSIANFEKLKPHEALQGTEHFAGFCKTFNLNHLKASQYGDLIDCQSPELCKAWFDVLSCVETKMTDYNKVLKSCSEKKKSFDYLNYLEDPDPCAAVRKKKDYEASRKFCGQTDVLDKELKALKDWLDKKKAEAP